MHPIVEQMKVSGEQEPAVVTRGCDIVVTAGAGTGKTRTLVARYLSLLAEGLELRSIVAITFTRKAAREMRNRVRDEIRRYLERSDVDAREHERWQKLYSALDAARIGTIHSLCADILRSHPAEAGVDPRFAVPEEGYGALLQGRAVDKALAWAADDEQAVELFALLGEQGLRSTLEVLIGKRLDAAEALNRLPADVLGHWRSVLSRNAPDLELNALDEKLAAALPALQATFHAALEHLEALKREDNTLDFDDLEGRALRLLQENEAVRSYWQGVVQAILMDEFQDTNQRQRDLVACLNDGHKLFIVGDAKQSIYRFRGADVAVFRREKERIEKGEGKHFPLQTSYRAHAELVEGLNDLLRPVLGTQDDPQRPWVEPFERLGYDPKHPGPGMSGPHIELQLALGTKSDGALERAAQALAARIAGLVAGGAQVMTRDGPRRLGFGDVAILCRASTSFPAYEDALERAGIPYLTVAGRGFYDRAEIRDLLNALRALADPSDDLALAGLLRSPALGLSDADLFRLCRARARTAGTPLWEIMQRPPASEDPWADDPARAERAVRLIADLHRQVGRTSVADLLKAFLDATDYRAALIRTGDARSARNVDKLLADAHASGTVGVGEFLEYWQGLQGSGAREGEARATAEGAVAIMSVHQAKGLEFPVVVIGDITHKSGAGSSTLLDPDVGIALKLEGKEGLKPALWELAERRADDQEEAEWKRLFYVAATRAQEKLILNGCIRPKGGNALGKCSGWLESIAGEDALRLEGRKVCYRPDGSGAIPLPLRVGKTDVACTVYEPAYPVETGALSAASQDEPDGVLWPPLLQPVAAWIESMDQRTAREERIPVQRVWRVAPAAKQPRAPAWVVGALVHEALAGWRFPEDYPAWDVQHSYERWAQARARSHGLADPDQLDDAVRRSAQLLVRFHAHPLYAEMARAEQRLHEVPYSVEAQGRVESGIIDVLYRRGADWTVVEFKTDELKDKAELDRLLQHEDYVPQARRYVAAVERLLGQKPRVVLCLLNMGGEVHLHTPSPADE